MPIYGYACNNCGHTLDALQKISEAPLVDCPDCGESDLKRQLSAPRFRLKGKGWYETDFKSDNRRNIAGEKEAAKASDKGDGKSKDSKSKDSKSKDGQSSGKKTEKTSTAKKPDSSASAA